MLAAQYFVHTNLCSRSQWQYINLFIIFFMKEEKNKNLNTVYNTLFIIKNVFIYVLNLLTAYIYMLPFDIVYLFSLFNLQFVIVVKYY